jgi:hypothetical protein
MPAGFVYSVTLMIGYGSGAGLSNAYGVVAVGMAGKGADMGKVRYA